MQISCGRSCWNLPWVYYPNPYSGRNLRLGFVLLLWACRSTTENISLSPSTQKPQWETKKWITPKLLMFLIYLPIMLRGFHMKISKVSLILEEVRIWRSCDYIDHGMREVPISNWAKLAGRWDWHWVLRWSWLQVREAKRLAERLKAHLLERW